ncbi:MAG: methyltransferase domain-containing protein [Lachnospiraceae bacterium]|nr:methyltransferase domain-containing protein [Lachnospiraceae bacterium]
MNINWNAKGYADHFQFVPRYGNALLELLDISEGMRCLDLGCGNGALTGKLADQRLLVTGLDDSSEMLEIAKKNYPGLAFVKGSAVDFALDEPQDIVFSNAVLHWIDPACQPNMLACIFRALKPGGQFVFEMGGKGCTANIHRAVRAEFESRGLSYSFPFFFPTIGEYAPMLEQAGFRVVYAVLFDRKTLLEGEDGMYDWIRMFLKKPFEGLDSEVSEEIVRAAVNALRPLLCENGTWYADYVRLRMKAVKR